MNKSSSPDPDLGLFLDAFATCDGFTFNVTRTAGPPAPAELQIRSASQWAVLSRDLVEDLLDQVHSFGPISASQILTKGLFCIFTAHKNDGIVNRNIMVKPFSRKCCHNGSSEEKLLEMVLG